MSLQIPGEDRYKASVVKFKDLLRKIMPDACVSVGAVLYEWLVRPLSIITQSAEDHVNTLADTYSLKYLGTSMNTEEGAADAILSNYFITRKGGRNATAVVRIKSTSGTTKIPSGAVFRTASISLSPVANYYGMVEGVESMVSTDTDQYVKAVYLDGYYYFNIQVQANDTTITVVSEGTPLEVDTFLASVESAEIASALSGGMVAESDAEMVERARVTVVSGIGGYNTITKMLMSSGVALYDAISLGAGDVSFTRDTNNPALIGMGGMVDTYVKTAQYPKSTVVTVHLTDGVYTQDVTNLLPKGFTHVTTVEVTTADGPVSGDVSISFGSSLGDNYAEHSRLSAYQTASLEFTPASSGISDDVDVTLTVFYLGDIDDLQEYASRPDKQIVGTDVMIKSAIPVMLRINASFVGEYDEGSVKDCIQQCVNTYPIGSSEFNIVDIQQYLDTNLPGVYLKSPVTIQATIPTMSGTGLSFITSDNGVLELPAMLGSIPRQAMYFCTTTDWITVHE